MSLSVRIAVTAGLVVVGVVADIVVGDSTFPGYGATIGLLGCLGLSLIAKGAVGPLLQRREDYYPADTPPEFHDDLYQAHLADPDARHGDTPGGGHVTGDTAAGDDPTGGADAPGGGA